MEKPAFDALVQKLTLFAKDYPDKYKFRVWLLAILGYSYVFIIIFLLLLSLATLSYFEFTALHSAIALKLILGLGFITFLVLKALWIRIPPPEGIALSREQAAPLFTVLDEIRQRLNAPKIHEILLDNRFNASIMQRPRLGILGWQKNYLVIGLPMMHALSPEQFTAVLAHEYGHLSGAHGTFGAWIYRIRQSWQVLMESLAVNNSWGMLLFRRFFNWYVPFFTAYSFVLARQHEYEADRSSAEIAGAKTAAQALIIIEIQGAFLATKFWDNLYKLADKYPQPPALYPLLSNSLQKNYKLANFMQTGLNKALALRTDSLDTHPALRERLAALGETATIPSAFTKSAAQVLLAPTFEALQSKISQQWQTQAGNAWQTRYEYVQRTTQQMQALQAKDLKTPLMPDELFQLAQNTMEFSGDKAAFPLFKRLLNNPKFATQAYFHVGRILLDNQQEKGIACIEKAVKQDASLLIVAYSKIVEFLEKQAATAAIKPYQQKIQARALLEQQAREERQQLPRSNETLLPHELSAAQLTALAKQFALEPTIKQVFIGRKNVQFLPENPFYFIGIKRTFGLRSALAEQTFLKRLSHLLTFPAQYMPVVFNGQLPQLENRLHQLTNGLVYDKRLYAKGLSVPQLTAPKAVPAARPLVRPVWLASLLIACVIAGLSYINNPVKEHLDMVLDQLEQPEVKLDEGKKPDLMVTAHHGDSLETFQFSHALPYDARLANGLQSAITQYSALFLPQPLNATYSVKQLDEWRYQASYQVQNKTYTATLSTKAEEVDNNLTELAAIMGNVAHDFPTQHVFANTPHELNMDYLVQQLDYTKIFIGFSNIEISLREGKSSAASLLNVSELWSWLAFFKTVQTNQALADSLVMQASSVWLVAQAFKNSLPADNYQRGLLLLALDYPAMALNVWQAKPPSAEREGKMVTLLQAFVKNDVATLEKQEEPLNLYLLTRAYKERVEWDVSETYGEKFLDKAPRHLLGAEYAITYGSIGLKRVSTPRYFSFLLKKQQELLATFFNVPFSDRLEVMMTAFSTVAKEQPPFTLIVSLHQQQLQKAKQLVQKKILFSGDLLKQLIDLDMKNAVTMLYDLEANRLARRPETDAILNAVKLYYPDSSLSFSLQLADFKHSAQAQRTLELIEKLDADKLDTNTLHELIQAYLVWRENMDSRLSIIAWLDKYRQRATPNMRGMLILHDAYKQLDYESVAARYLNNAEKTNPYSVELWTEISAKDTQGAFIARAKAALGETYPFFITYADWAIAQKKNTEAIAAYQQAIKLSPSMFHAYSKLSNYYIDNKSYQDAAAVLLNYLKDNEETFSSYTALSKIGRIYLLQQDYKRAYELYSTSKESGQGTGLIGFAKASEKMGKPAEALFRAAAERYPQSPKIVMELGLFYLRQQQVEKAIASFEEYSRYQYLCYYCEDLVNYYQELGQPEAAIAIVSRVTQGEESPNARLAYLATIYRQKALYKPALDILKRLAMNTDKPRENRPFDYVAPYVNTLVQSGEKDLKPFVRELIDAYKIVHIGLLEPLGIMLAKAGYYDLAFMVDKVLYEEFHSPQRPMRATVMMLAISWQLGSQQAEDKAFVEKVLAESTGYDDWTRQKFDALLNKTPMESLLSQATNDERRNEIYYFLGGMAAAKGEKEKAKDLLLISLATNTLNSLEYPMAYGLLKRLVGEKD